MREITSTEVDGVRTLWAPCDGPLHARLAFRVGSADETLGSSGWSHLVEHLALFGIDDAGSHHNGSVDQTTTVFHITGGTDEVRAFLAHVTSALAALPFHRLEQEKSVLAVEGERRGPWLGDPMLVWRFGAVRHGLAALPQWGVRGATAEQLQEWSATRFTRGNAVLVLTGAPPAGLRVELPEGELVPPPPVVEQLDRLPAWFRQDIGGVAAGAIVARSNESVVLAAVAGHLLHERLRTEQALSYSPQTYYERLDATKAHVILYADGAAERLTALTEAFGKLVQEIGVPQPELVGRLVETMIQRRQQAHLRPDELTIAELVSLADDHLYGRQHETPDETLAELRATDPEGVAAVGRDFLRTALYDVPSVRFDTTFFGTAAPLSTVETPAGKSFTHRDAPLVASRMVVGPYGVARWEADQPVGAVRFDRLAGVLAWADGGIALVGVDGTQLPVEPTLWRNGPAARGLVLAKVDPGLVIGLGERPLGTVPYPASTRGQRMRARGRRAARSLGAVALSTLIAVTPGLILVTIGAYVYPFPPVFAGIGAVVLGRAALHWRDLRRS